MSTAAQLADCLAWLQSHASTKVRDEMGPRYGIHTDRAFGVPMAQMKVLAKQTGVDHSLADALWKSGWYEARIVASLADDPAVVTPMQMDRWCGAFDNWAICDTVCFNLFDRTPHAWSKVDEWAASDVEFVRRAAFALLWSLALHDKTAADGRFLHGLALIEQGVDDDRPLIGKSLAMAMRAIAHRNAALAAAVAAAPVRITGARVKRR